MKQALLLPFCVVLCACKWPMVSNSIQANQWQGLYQGEIREEGKYLQFEMLIEEDLDYEMALYDFYKNQKERFKGKAKVDSNLLILQLKNGIRFSILPTGHCLSSSYEAFSLQRLNPDSNYFNQSWQVIQLGDNYLAMDIENNLTLSFVSDSIFGGYSGCNSYGGILAKNVKGKLRFHELNTTLLYCDDAMELEEFYTSALPQVRAYRFKDPEHLSLLDSNGNTIIYLHRAMLLD